jgi:deoxyribose-phosphate aldolase
MIDAIRDYYLRYRHRDRHEAGRRHPHGKTGADLPGRVKETLGDAWLTPARYRFGASSLLNDLLRQLEKERTGAYQAPYAFSEATESY